MGLDESTADARLRGAPSRIEAIEARLEQLDRRAAREPGRAAACTGTGRLRGPRGRGRHRRRLDELEADACCWPPAAGPASPTGPRSTASASSPRATRYPPPELPEHLVVIGSGVTGVEFVHMFSSLRLQVTLIVSRQQVLPHEGPRGRRRARGRLPARGVRLLKGARATAIERIDDARRSCGATTAAVGHGHPRAAGHRLDPEHRGPRARRRRGRDRRRRLRRHRPPLPVERARTSTPPATCRASCRCRRSPRCRGARSPSTPWGCTRASTATSTTTRRPRPSSPSPRSPTWAWPRPTRSPRGRKIRVTKVPFSAQRQGADRERPPRLREDHLRSRHRRRARRFDRRAPRRRADLGDRPGRHRRPEGQRHLESLLVHPALAEALADAAE